MKTPNFRAPSLRSLVLLAVGWVLAGASLPGADVRSAGRTFARPGREYATAPLWVWNDQLTEDQVRTTLRDLTSQHVRQVFVHPRPGLMTPYLSDEWMRLWRVALDEAKRRDMNVWIYDENSYPSGFAGGWVPELMPESRGRGLHFRETTEPAWASGVLGIYQVDGERANDLSPAAREGRGVPSGAVWVAEVRRAGNSPWHGNRCYVDLLYPGVTERFLDVTLGAYERVIGKEFGRRVPGVFTDEPELRPAGGLPWTDDLPEQFERRWGYPLLPQLMSLQRDVGDWRRVRHNYYQTLLDLFIERWGRPYYERCERLGLEFTGHYWDHEWPNCGAVPDNMAMAAWQHRPGIDILMNQYAENTHAQFGNVRSCREISSLANQLGRDRTLVELYGAGGWDLRFEDMKRIADWLQVLGVNTLDEHLSYITLRGARKRDHPQSFSYHEPWWPEYGVMAEYSTRLSAAMSQGEQHNPVLVLEPTTTAWMLQGRPELRPLGDEFFALLMGLERAQVEYDLACEDVLAREGSVDAPSFAGNQRLTSTLRVGRRSYRVVVLPPHTENLNARTAELLQKYLETGGAVIACGEPPTRLDGREAPELAALARMPRWTTVAASAVPEAVQPWTDQRFRIERAANDPGILFHHRRQLEDGELVLLINTSIDHPSRGTVFSPRPGVERWDPWTGARTPEEMTRTDAGVAVEFELPPCGSRLLCFTDRRTRAPQGKDSAPQIALSLAGRVTVERLEPNVLTLDYVDITAGGEALTQAYFYEAQQFAFRRNGMERNPWDSAVQFKDELITRTFPETSGFVATYRFTVEGKVPANLEAVVERPDLYTITCNGQAVAPVPGRWWLDRSFGCLPLSEAARVGVNELVLSAQPFTIFHELEPVYLRGDFSLRAAEHGFALAPDAGLALSDAGWSQQGHPHYAGSVAYRQTLDLDRKGGRTWVTLPSWYGSVATVKVNGEAAGTIVSAPWECEITGKLRRGANEIEVVVTGTLKNTLGPHHGKPGRGSAWPGMFHQGPKGGPPPGADYDTIRYGLFAPFQVKRVASP